MKKLLTAAMFLSGSVAMAESYNLHQYKSWSVYLETPDNAPMYCHARTENRHGDSLQLTAYATGNVFLFIFMAPDYEGWEGAFDADLRIDIDYTKWTLNDASFLGDGPQETIFFEFPAGQKFSDFLKDFWEGSAIALKTSSGETSIAVWSLSGSASALSALNECADRIGSEKPKVRM